MDVVARVLRHVDRRAACGRNDEDLAVERRVVPRERQPRRVRGPVELDRAPAREQHVGSLGRGPGDDQVALPPPVREVLSVRRESRQVLVLGRGREPPLDKPGGAVEQAVVAVRRRGRVEVGLAVASGDVDELLAVGPPRHVPLPRDRARDPDRRRRRDGRGVPRPAGDHVDVAADHEGHLGPVGRDHDLPGLRLLGPPDGLRLEGVAAHGDVQLSRRRGPVRRQDVDGVPELVGGEPPVGGRRGVADVASGVVGQLRDLLGGEVHPVEVAVVPAAVAAEHQRAGTGPGDPVLVPRRVGQPPQCARRPLDQPQVPVRRATVVASVRRRSAAHEGDPAPVRRRPGLRGELLQGELLGAAGERNLVDCRLPVPGLVTPGSEQHRAANEAPHQVRRLVEREPHRRGRVLEPVDGGDQVDVVGTGPVGNERQRASVRRERRMVVVPGARCEPAGGTAGSRNQPEVAVPGEDDP